jgi:trypsin
MHRILVLLGATAAALLLSALPAVAITNGAPDGSAHPYVGVMVTQDADGTPLDACSGTLLSPTVFVTAGHCTWGAAHAEIWLDSGYPAPIPLAAGYGAEPAHPCAGVTGFPCTGDSGGAVFTHPDFSPDAFVLHDVGVVVLDRPVQLAAYGALPAENQLAGLKASAHTTFTTVGYGMQRSFPEQGRSSLKDVAIWTRMVASPHLVTIGNPSLGDQTLVLSGDASTGGTCFGDSGGPNLLGDSNVVAAVTSGGKSDTCGGTYAAFRLDLPSARNWVSGFLR